MTKPVRETREQRAWKNYQGRLRALQYYASNAYDIHAIVDDIEKDMDNNRENRYSPFWGSLFSVATSLDFETYQRARELIEAHDALPPLVKPSRKARKPGKQRKMH